MEDLKHYIWTSGSDEEIEEWKKTIDKPTCQLDELGRKYNSDKCNVQYMSWNPPANGNVPRDWPQDLHLPVVGHNYVEIYDQTFMPIKNESLKILEIGMGVWPWNGHSMRIWLEYFPNAELHIIDNVANNFQCNFDFDNSRVKFHVLDQSNEEQLQRFVDSQPARYFDIIIDDGSHQADHQILTLRKFFNNLLKENGFYFVEDIHDRKFLNYVQELFISANSGNETFKNGEETIKDVASIKLMRSLVMLQRGRKITR